MCSSDSLRCKDGIYLGGDDGLDVAQSGVLDRRDTRYLGAWTLVNNCRPS